MEPWDRCLLPRQYIYPNSHQHLSILPIRPFVVNSDELENCVCETHSIGLKCPYHAVLSVAPEEHSGAMKAVVESHDLVIEAGQLLLTTRAHTQDQDYDRLGRPRGVVESSEEGAALEKGAVKMIKAVLLHGGTNVHIPLAPMREFGERLAVCGLAEGFGPLEEGESAEKRARGLSWLHLVTSVPLMMWQSRAKLRYNAAIRTASIALALLKEEGRNWEPLLDRHGQTMWNLELALCMQQSHTITYIKPEDKSDEESLEHGRYLADNISTIRMREPTNRMNAVPLKTGCMLLGHNEFACQVLRMVMEEADERGDHQISSMMRWHLCHTILLGGEGRSVQVAEILKLVKEARTALEQAAEWGFHSRMTPAKEPSTYWPCLGFAARCTAAIKADPSYAQSTVDAFESSEVLDQEKRHVMCAQCGKLCDTLLRCSACKLVAYCSRNCQVKHWKAGHKQVCNGQQ
ncbi:hypothetical protein COCOBI_15-4360 [Coccomyxa sp. Obi]|nr:hypothetical protein COCOBI_15-4360 [Coccomyxa sp. Obi]